MSKQPAILSVHGRAAKQLDSFDPPVQKKYLTFAAHMADDINHKSLHFQKLNSSSGLYSARVGSEHRAVMVHVAENQYLLLAVQHRSESYERLAERFTVTVNQVSGTIEVVDLDKVAEKLKPALEDPRPQRRVTEEKQGLFTPFGETVLRELGVSDWLLDPIMRIQTEDELLELCEVIPALTRDILIELHSGKSVDDVMEYITRPAAVDDVDTTDLAAALERSKNIDVVSSDEAVQAMQAGKFTAWRLFLHPSQQRIIDRDYSGPARVSGGPGTGKTVVALHRVARLAHSLLGGRILLTTYNTNLASYLKVQLGELLDKDLMKKVDVIGIDKLVRRIYTEDGATPAKLLTHDEAHKWWSAVITETGITEFDADFLHEEWTEVVCGQLLRGRADYFAARRAGRSRRLSRQQRSRLWKLVEAFTARLVQENRWTFEWLTAQAALAEEQRSATGAHRYAHVVVDEAQDLTAGHWRLLRTLVPHGPNDLFIAGDTHQRIYGPALSLSPMGINIRGRSTRLTLSYRTTRQILATALGMVSGETYDDLDDGVETLAGYRAVNSGSRPHRIATADTAEERTAVVTQVQAWKDVEPDTVAVCAPDRAQVASLLTALQDAGIDAGEVTREGPPKGSVVHVATLKRLKGMEYRNVVIAGIGAADYPRPQTVSKETRDPAAYRARLRQERCELFVAATRARDALTLIWRGDASRFLVTA